MIPVTKSFFPPIEDYQKQVERIWDNQWLTNNGELYQELSTKLEKYLGVNHIIPMTNGTLPIQIALNAYGKGGEVITTPFSYVATTASIVWEHCTPVFVDIHPKYLTIDETKIEAAITDRTTVILATHVYGNPCNVEAIAHIAQKYDLKVIYDAAHCFGVTYKGQSLFNYGDVSTCSFHATKLFHTGEGGALFCQDEASRQDMWYRHNFGHDGPLKYHGLGINGKMSELQAAMGLSVLPYIDKIIAERKAICRQYRDAFADADIQTLRIRAETKWNGAYFPIVLPDHQHLIKVEARLKAHDILPRRYFAPSLEQLPYIDQNTCPIAQDIAERVLCLPLFVGLGEASIEKICVVIKNKVQ